MIEPLLRMRFFSPCVFSSAHAMLALCWCACSARFAWQPCICSIIVLALVTCIVVVQCVTVWVPQEAQIWWDIGSAYRLTIDRLTLLRSIWYSPAVLLVWVFRVAVCFTVGTTTMLHTQLWWTSIFFFSSFFIFLVLLSAILSAQCSIFALSSRRVFVPFLLFVVCSALCMFVRRFSFGWPLQLFFLCKCVRANIGQHLVRLHRCTYRCAHGFVCAALSLLLSGAFLRCCECLSALYSNGVADASILWLWNDFQVACITCDYFSMLCWFDEIR